MAQIFTGRRERWLQLARSWALALLVGVGALQLSGCDSMATPDIPLETLKQKYTNQYSKFIEIDGTMIHYRDQGSGPPLVLVHGMVSSLHTWDGWQTYLGGKYRIIRFDVPGFGLTGPLAQGEYNAETYVRIIDQLLNKLGVNEKITLAGNSLGGFMAWNYAARHPERVDRLVLLDAPAFKQEVPLVVKMANWPGADSIGVRYSPRFLVAANLKKLFANQGVVTDELIDRYYELTLRPGNRPAILAGSTARHNAFHDRSLPLVTRHTRQRGGSTDSEPIAAHRLAPGLAVSLDAPSAARDAPGRELAGT